MIDVWQPAVAVHERAEVGEGPWWDAPRGRLLWVDIPNGLIRSHTPATGRDDERELQEPVGFVVGVASGGFIAGTASGLVQLDAELHPVTPVGAPPDLGGRLRINDGVCDPAGRVLFGTVDPTGQDTGTLWSHAADAGFVPLIGEVGMSNGLAFSPDGSCLYFADSRAGQVDAFSYDVRAGTVAARRMLIAVPEEVGLPDGLAVDRGGCIWVALWGAGEIWRLTPDGDRIGRVEMPVARPTSCVFGGVDGDELYITTARDDLEADAVHPASGAVFTVRVGIRGARVWNAAPTGASRLDTSTPGDRMK